VLTAPSHRRPERSDEWSGQLARILIAEDDPLIGALLEKVLRANGYSTLLADDGEKAESLSVTDEFDLLILDMGLPKRHGLQVLRDLRSRGNAIPVLVLTGRSARHIPTYIAAGADDYMRKPFRFDELLARVERGLRRAGTAEPNVLRAGVIRIDLRSRQTTVNGRSVELTGREFELLETLVHNSGQILSRGELLSKIWGDSFEVTSNVVEFYVNSLRKKLGTGMIETVRGAGYRLQTH
jgi:DNA-binding response OmpR family regulator